MKSTMTMRQWAALIGLTCSAFLVNTSEFIPIGLLTDIASEFGIGEATAGIMISAYAWVVALLSLPLMILASRMEYKRLILTVLTLFCAGQLLSAVAPTYVVLVLARLLVACAHAVFWSIASVMATRVSGEEHSSLALSMVVTGTSIAMIFGLPLGRSIGLLVGWRMTFTIVGAIAAAIAVYLGFVFPRMAAGEAFSARNLPSLLKNPVLMCMYGVTLLFACGYYTGYSYIEPFFQQVGGLDNGVITIALTVFGVAGLAGSLSFSRLYEGRRFLFIRVTTAGVALSLALMALCSGSFLTAAAVCALWGASATAFNVAFQAEIIRNAAEDESAVAMSIFSGIFNLGIGLGTTVGGVVMSAISLDAIGYVGAIIAGAAFVLAATVLVRAMCARGSASAA